MISSCYVSHYQRVDHYVHLYPQILMLWIPNRPALLVGSWWMNLRKAWESTKITPGMVEANTKKSWVSRFGYKKTHEHRHTHTQKLAEKLKLSLEPLKKSGDSSKKAWMGFSRENPKLHYLHGSIQKLHQLQRTTINLSTSRKRDSFCLACLPQQSIRRWARSSFTVDLWSPGSLWSILRSFLKSK